MNEFGRITRLSDKRASEPQAFATLVRAKGSSYRRPGARMLICADGATAGTLSAGCIEEEVCQRAVDVFRTGKSQMLSFDTRRRFGCNGSIEIFIERADRTLLQMVRECLKGRRACTLETVFEGEESALGTHLLGNNAPAVHGSLIQVVEPSIRLLVIGDGPDAEALRLQAALLDWDANCVESIPAWHGTADNRTAAVIATHNYGRDCAALRHLLPLGLRYVGLVGPRRRREELLSDVIDSGAALASELYAPAGFHLSAETAGEIALSIVAEIQAVFSGANGLSLRDRTAPIHAAAPCPELAR